MIDDAALDPAERRARDRRRLWFVVAATIVVAAYLFLWTLGTSPIIGDEARHYRRAVNCFESPWPDIRATHDTAYPAEGRGAVLYWDSCLWHLGLAVIWRVLGSPSMLAAQLYHTAFLLILGLFTYLCGRQFWGHRGGLWAWALVLSIPMNLLFGMTFYMEVPVMAFTAVAIYCLLRRRPVLMGLAMAAMFLIKATSSAVLIPPLLAVSLLVIGDSWRQRLLRTLLAAVVLVIALTPDLVWRQVHFGHLIMFRQQLGFATFYPSDIELDLIRMSSPDWAAVALSIFDPKSVVRTFGVTGIVAVAAALVVSVAGLLRGTSDLLRRSLKEGLLAAWRHLPEAVPRPVLVLGVPMLCYMASYAVLLRGAYDVRYLQPITLFAGLLLAGGLSRLSLWLPKAIPGRLGTAAAVFLVLAVAGQFLAAPPVIASGQFLAVPVATECRRLPENIDQAFQWIRENTPPSARFLYLEENLTTLTGRPIFWTVAIPRYLFTTTEDKQVRLLTFVGIDYIAIHPTRRGPPADRNIEATCYPRDWVASLERRPYLTRLYPASLDGDGQGKFLIYRVDRDRMPPEWRSDTRIGEHGPEALKPGP